MKWVRDVRDQRDEVILVIVGNKTDLSENRFEFSAVYHGRAVTIEEGQKLAADNNALFFESSAKCNYNIDTVFRKVVEKLPGELHRAWKIVSILQLEQVLVWVLLQMENYYMECFIQRQVICY